jgi:hypothetical protein
MCPYPEKSAGGQNVPTAFVYPEKFHANAVPVFQCRCFRRLWPLSFRYGGDFFWQGGGEGVGKSFPAGSGIGLLFCPVLFSLS